jgi:hypothetical protein
MANNDFDLRDLPSWKYFGWGIFNGLLLGILIVNKMDISETGIMSIILEAFKPILTNLNMSTIWITITVFFLGLLGILSTVYEVYSIWEKGIIPIIIAVLGFFSILLILLNVQTLGAILLVGGALLVRFFPDE